MATTTTTTTTVTTSSGSSGGLAASSMYLLATQGLLTSNFEFPRMVSIYLWIGVIKGPSAVGSWKFSVSCFFFFQSRLVFFFFFFSWSRLLEFDNLWHITITKRCFVLVNYHCAGVFQCQWFGLGMYVCISIRIAEWLSGRVFFLWEYATCVEYAVCITHPAWIRSSK